jgi:hypothetical protein
MKPTGRVAQSLNCRSYRNYGCPSIRVKAVSRTKVSCRCFWHRFFGCRPTFDSPRVRLPHSSAFCAEGVCPEPAKGWEPRTSIPYSFVHHRAPVIPANADALAADSRRQRPWVPTHREPRNVGQPQLLRSEQVSKLGQAQAAIPITRLRPPSIPARHGVRRISLYDSGTMPRGGGQW